MHTYVIYSSQKQHFNKKSEQTKKCKIIPDSQNEWFRRVEDHLRGYSKRRKDSRVEGIGFEFQTPPDLNYLPQTLIYILCVVFLQ